MTKTNKGCLTKFKTVSIWFFLIFGLLLGGIAIINLNLSDSSVSLNTLSTTDQYSLQETDRLRKSVGNLIWPGFGDQEIPIILYNEAYVFLSGLKDPETGWKKVPFTKQMGSRWTYIESTPSFFYYTQPIISSDQTPEAFTVQNGEYYAASMTTKEWTEIKLTQLIKTDLPSFLKPIFPYSLITGKFNTDWHISAIIHESFHAFQAEKALERVRSAEASNTFENSYPWKNPDFRQAWLNERLLLAKILKASDDQKIRTLTKEWLQIRKQRRNTFNSPKLTAYEKEREWLEGLGKYAEIKSWLLASDPGLYEPLQQMSSIPDFDHYKNGVKNRNREIKQLRSNLSFSETVFYYSGWAQAEILDYLDPGWKVKAFEPGMYLDDMIRNIFEPKAIAETK
ncbi:hypothetical protein ACKGJO_08730 [Gracilimonas sp. Q87]|uniref:hypothetical protein n=1 Tax=Gracilimonas sp. Q87 TaxID=3384766 RepID=UPI0039840A12